MMEKTKVYLKGVMKERQMVEKMVERMGQMMDYLRVLMRERQMADKMVEKKADEMDEKKAE